MDGLNSRMEGTEKRTNELEDRTKSIIQHGENRLKTKTEQSLSDLWDYKI